MKIPLKKYPVSMTLEKKILAAPNSIRTKYFLHGRTTANIFKWGLNKSPNCGDAREAYKPMTTSSVKKFERDDQAVVRRGEQWSHGAEVKRTDSQRSGCHFESRTHHNKTTLAHEEEIKIQCYYLSHSSLQAFDFIFTWRNFTSWSAKWKETAAI